MPGSRLSGLADHTFHWISLFLSSKPDDFQLNSLIDSTQQGLNFFHNWIFGRTLSTMATLKNGEIFKMTMVVGERLNG
jgi:hypothetical protein